MDKLPAKCYCERLEKKISKIFRQSIEKSLLVVKSLLFFHKIVSVLTLLGAVVEEVKVEDIRYSPPPFLPSSSFFLDYVKFCTANT